MNKSGTFYVHDSMNHYLTRSTADGSWYFVEAGNVTASITTAGTITAVAHLFAKANVYAANDWTFYFGLGGMGKLFNFGTGWAFDFNTTNGVLNWNTTSGAFWSFRNTDWWTYNNFGVVAGHGWVDLSDERTKENIEPITKGLLELLQLNPISYKRRSIAETTRLAQTELGFSAQDVMKVLPDAVYETGMDLGKDFEGTALGIMTSNILALAVNAIKQLTERVVTLESTLATRSARQ
jgi:hypothetical protein